NGVLDFAERCDAGPAGSTCCPIPTCQPAAAGSPCTPDAHGCTTDVCDGTGSCMHPLASAGTVCRPAANSCDVAETCDGSSPACPADQQLTVDSDGDGIPDCRDLCTGGAASNVLVRMINASKPSARLVIRGAARLSTPLTPPLDPVAHGIRLVIEQAGAPFRDVTVPGVAYQAQTRTGWTAKGRRWTVVSPVALGGLISRVKLSMAAGVPGRLRFDIVAQSVGAFAPPVLPLKITLVLDPPFATKGECTEAIPTCVHKGGGTGLLCQ